MKRTYLVGAAFAFATTAASAADLPSRAAPPVFVPPVAAPVDWTGLEFGLTTSFNFDSHQPVNTIATGGAAARPGFVSLNKNTTDDVGGGVGYNYQFHGTGIVVGGMFDFSYFDIKKNAPLLTPTGGVVPNYAYFHERLSYLGTANGLLGYAIDRFLIYGTGGFAFGGTHYGATFYGAVPPDVGTLNQVSTGYDFGGGVEYAIPKDSFLNYLSVEKLLGLDKTIGLDAFDGTVRVEYIHYNLGSKSVTALGGDPGSYVSTFRTNGNVIRVGLGYKFGSGPAPVVARY